MSFPVYLDGLMERVQRSDMPEDEAEALIDQAAQMAADQVRNECRTRRQTELNISGRQRQIAAEQDRIGQANIKRVEAEAEVSRRRNEALKATGR